MLVINMKRISILIVIFILFSIPAWAIYQSSTFGNRSGVAAGGGGTDWTSYAALEGLYYFETSPGIEQDSSGNGNHIDDAANITAPSADTTDYIEGSQSADYAGDNDTGSILDLDNAGADFPLNGAGDGEITVAGWIIVSSFSTSDYVVNIGSGQFAISFDDSQHLEGFLNGTSGVTLTGVNALDTGKWFIALVYSDSADYGYLYYRKEGAGSSYWEATAADIGTLDDASSGVFAVGCYDDSDGNAKTLQGSIDALGVFNGKAFSQAELDEVFSCGWDGNGC